MLEGLDDIDWSQYYNANAGMPDFIRKIADASKQISDDEFNRLSDRLIYQDIIHPGTAIVIPFLIEIVDSNTTPDYVKVKLLDIIYNCSWGMGPLGVHIYSGSLEKILSGSPQIEEHLKEQYEMVWDIYNAIVDGLPTYIKRLDDNNDKEIRIAAGSLISICHSRLDEASEALEFWIAIERELHEENNITSSLVYNLGYLVRTEPFSVPHGNFTQDYNVLFKNWMFDEAFPFEGRVAAANRLIDYGDDDARNQALDFIDHIMDNPLFDIGNYVPPIIYRLRNYDFELALDWLSRLYHHIDEKTVDIIIYNIHAAYSLFRVDTERVLEMLQKILQHPDMKVRINGVEADGFRYFCWSYLGISNFLEQLLLDEKDEQVSTKIKGILAEIKEYRSYPATLSERLADYTPPDLDLAQVLDKLEELSKNLKPPRKTYVLINLIGRLGEFGEQALEYKRTVPFLKNFVDDNNRGVRIRAIRSLALIAPKENEAILVPALIDEINSFHEGLVAMNTVAILVQAGIDMTAALPRIEKFANSKRRFGNGTIQDRQIQEIAQNTIHIINGSDKAMDYDDLPFNKEIVRMKLLKKQES